jgi:hypothetical protein
MTPKQQPGWTANPHTTKHHESDDILIGSDGANLARVEDFGYACYPCAISAKTGNLERGGPMRDRVEAKLWAERVAGLHPNKPGDERPPFYYSAEGK